MTTNQSYEPTSDAITPVEYGGLQRAFDHLNTALFGSALPDCLLTLQRRANSGGHFGADRFSERGGTKREHEINLNPDGFVGKNDEFIVSILLHEQSALVAARAWYEQAEAGRLPQQGMGDEDDHARSHAVDQPVWSAARSLARAWPTTSSTDGPFTKAFAELAASGWKLNLESTKVLGTPRGRESKVKFTCPECAQNVWGKPDTYVFCGPCLETTDRLIRMMSAQSEPIAEQTRRVAA